MDLILIPVTYVYVTFVIILSTWLKRNEKVSGEIARKIVHLGIGIMVVLAPLLFSNFLIPFLIGVSFVIFTFFTSPVSPVPALKLSAFSDGHGLGTVYYSISLTVLLLFFIEHGWIIQAGFLPLVFGDAFAYIIGSRYGSYSWIFVSDKTIEGTIAAFLSTLIAVVSSLLLYYHLGEFSGSIKLIVILGLVEGVVIAVVELISPYGLDNLTIPAMCTLVAVLLGPVPADFLLAIA